MADLSEETAQPTLQDELDALAARLVDAARWLREHPAASLPVPDPAALAGAGAALAGALALDPAALDQLRRAPLDALAEVLKSQLAALGGPALAEPPLADRRFRHQAWQRSPPHLLLARLYLATAERLRRATRELPALDPADRRAVRFWIDQLIDAASPANALWTNPVALETALETGGRSLVRGLRHLVDDLAAGRAPFPRTVPDSALELGRDLAVTPGKVIARNELMELIQYAPATERVHRRPLLICPPWINKYYILDLRPATSFVRFAVEQGHTVFLISWVNPGPEHAQVGFDDYLRLGPLAALATIRRATGEARVNALGYCLGGTLLACCLAWLARGRTRPIASATFLTCLLDFSEPGDLGVFLDPGQLERLERHLERRGYLEAAAMSRVFALLRANDLIWSFVQSSYLMGREPPAFDLLQWNADGTNMPARMHGFYLRALYGENRLARPGGITLLGRPIDLGASEVPAYFLSTREDHIAPWRSTFRGHRLLGGPKRFVLGGSGHIAGVINPAGSRKYGCWSDGPASDDPDAWLAGAIAREGSWWPDWARWLASHGGGERPARVPGGGSEVLDDAPGRYVRMRAGP